MLMRDTLREIQPFAFFLLMARFVNAPGRDRFLADKRGWVLTFGNEGDRGWFQRVLPPDGNTQLEEAPLIWALWRAFNVPRPFPDVVLRAPRTARTGPEPPSTSRWW